MLKAAIDIGTNTSHIIIADVIDDKVQSILYRKRFYTYIAADGIDTISQAAIGRLMKAIEHFYMKLTEYRVVSCACVGTEALRSADNGIQIIADVQQKYGIDIDIISGTHEAKLIYQGVKQVADLSRGHSLIVDIGGGSVEFIEVSDGKVDHVVSYPIGIARLFKLYHHTDPISANDIHKMYHHIDSYIEDLMNRSKINGAQIIGSAGTFEAIAPDMNTNECSILTKIDFDKYYEEVVPMRLEDRMISSIIPHERAKYIVAALILVRYIFDQSNTDSITISPYSLKEGLLTQ